MPQHAISSEGAGSSKGKERQVVLEYIQNKLDELPDLEESCCIYRVPKLLRSVNPEAYTPISIPIGPLHQEDYGQHSTSCDGPDLFCNGLYKYKCLKSFLDESKLSLESCLDIVDSKSQEIRACYAHSIKIFCDNEVFNEMILLDCVFVIEFFRNKTRSRDQRDPMWMSFKAKEIARDIMLIENQIPFFILEELCDHGYNESFMEIALDFFKIKHERFTFVQNSRPCHLLDMLRVSWLPYNKNARGDISPETRRRQLEDLANKKSSNGGGLAINRQAITCPTATGLYEAGIKFVVRKNALSLLDIHFERGVLYVPKFNVDDETECLLRNLIAFEKSRTKDDNNYITDYMFFLDCLINTPTDVQMLTDAGIIENWLGSEKKLADLINSMGRHVYDFSRGYLYTGLAEQLTTYHEKKWNRYRAILKQVYFSHPWAAIPVAYAVVLLLLTIIQATGSVIDIVQSLRGKKQNR